MAGYRTIKAVCQFCRAARVEVFGNPCRDPECQRKARELDDALR